MTVWVLVFGAVVAAGGMRVETGTPAALCPDIGEVRRAVRDRLNVEGDGEWLASFDLVHRPGGARATSCAWSCAIRRAGCACAATCPRSGESCVALAQAVALVLESFFRHPTEPASTTRRGSAPHR